MLENLGSRWGLFPNALIISLEALDEQLWLVMQLKTYHLGRSPHVTQKIVDGLCRVDAPSPHVGIFHELERMYLTAVTSQVGSHDSPDEHVEVDVPLRHENSVKNTDQRVAAITVNGGTSQKRSQDSLRPHCRWRRSEVLCGYSKTLLRTLLSRADPPTIQ